MNYSGLKVKCKNCGEIFYETTDVFTPEKILTGEMLRWTEKYGPNGLNWSLMFAAHDLAEAIICEGCGEPVAPTGRLSLDGLNVTKDPKGQDDGEKKEISREESQVREKPETEVQEEIVNPAIQNFPCPECGGHFMGQDAFLNHILSHPKEIQDKILGGDKGKNIPAEPEVPKKRPSRSKTNRVAEVKESEFECMVCGGGFLDEEKLRNHAKTCSQGTAGIQRKAVNE